MMTEQTVKHISIQHPFKLNFTLVSIYRNETNPWTHPLKTQNTVGMDHGRTRIFWEGELKLISSKILIEWPILARHTVDLSKRINNTRRQEKFHELAVWKSNTWLLLCGSFTHCYFLLHQAIRFQSALTKKFSNHEILKACEAKLNEKPKFRGAQIYFIQG